MLKAITFDLGDTLIDYGPMDYAAMLRYGLGRAWAHLAELPGTGAGDRASFDARIGRAVRHTWYRSKFLVEDRNVETAIAEALDRLGIRLDEPGRHELVRQFFSGLWRLTRAMPGAADVLGQLRGRGLELAVLSNTVLPPWLLDESLASVGLLGHFPRRFYSCALGMKKPQRRIFRHVLAEMEVAPDELMHVGDRYLTDIWGAKRSGVWTCLMEGHRSLPLPPVRPDFRVRHMSQLVEIADALRSDHPPG